MPSAQRPVCTVIPAELPVSRARLKEHLRVDSAHEDLLIQSYLDAAVAHCDGWAGILGRCLVTQTWTQSWSGFPGCDGLGLPFPDVSSVALVYTDTAGAVQTFAPAKYHVVRDALGASVVLAEGQVWPQTANRPDALRVTMVAGYGPAAAVPEQIKVAVMLLAAHWYDNREAVTTGTAMSVPLAFEALTGPHRHVGF